MNCDFCGVQYNDVLTGYENDFIIYYFFECGNAYDAVQDLWIDNCCSQPRWPQ